MNFYQEIAPTTLAPTPSFYYGAADKDAGAVVMLLEDLGSAGTGDVLRGCSAEDAGLVLDGIAPLHAGWWRLATTAPAPFRWLPTWIGDIAAQHKHYGRQVGPFLDRWGDSLPVEVVRIVERLRARYGAVLASLDDAPKTLIHADLHLDNVMFRVDRPTSRAVIVDWQSVCWGPAAIDVARLVFTSLSSGERRNAEDGLFQRYLNLIPARGVGS